MCKYLKATKKEMTLVHVSQAQTRVISGRSWYLTSFVYPPILRSTFYSFPHSTREILFSFFSLTEKQLFRGLSAGRGKRRVVHDLDHLDNTLAFMLGSVCFACYVFVSRLRFRSRCVLLVLRIKIVSLLCHWRVPPLL